MENLHIEVELLRSNLKCNDYFVNIINQCIKKFLDNLYVPKQILPEVPKRELLVVLPYLGTFSLNLRKLLYRLVSNSLLKYNIKVIFSVQKLIGVRKTTFYDKSSFQKTVFKSKNWICRKKLFSLH